MTVKRGHCHGDSRTLVTATENDVNNDFAMIYALAR